MQFLVLSLIPLAAFVILIILLARSSGHSTRIGNLEWQTKKLPALERQINELIATVESLKSQLDELKSPTSRRKESSPAITKPTLPEKRLPTAQTAPLPMATIPSSPQAAAEAPAPSRTREEWEALIGGKLFNRIGALALIIGIGYFLKYAFDNNWINETTRVPIGAVVGFACLGGGYRTNKKGFQVFAQGLVGAGIAILYLSVYAAFNFYQLLPQWVAFVFMSVVTIIAFLNGLFYDSLAESLLGWAGGFLTPILLSTGQANEIGLFTYIVLLDAGLLAVLVRKERWWVLEPLTFAGTWLMYLLWRDPYYTDADLWITVFFLTLFWLLFFITDLFRSRKAGTGTAVDQIIPGLNALFYFLSVYFLINKDHHAWMGLVALLIGGAYFGTYLLQQRRGSASGSSGTRMILTTLGMVVVATSIQFSDFDTVMAWSIEAALLVWLSNQEDVKYLPIAALGLFGLGAFKLLVLTDGALVYTPITDFTPALNHRALTFAIAGVALGFSAFVVARSDGRRNEISSNILHSAWCTMLFLMVTVETSDFFRLHSLGRPEQMVEQMSFFRLMTLGVVWISASLPLMWVGLKKSLMPLVVSALVFALLAVVFDAVRGLAFDPIETFAPIVNVRSISLLLLTTGLMLQSELIQKSSGRFDWLGDTLNYVRVGMVIVILVLLTGETRDYFQKDIVFLSKQHGLDDAGLIHLENMQQLMLSAVWMFYSVVLMSVGIWRKYRGMRFVAIALFGITILKIFLYDLSFLETLYRIFSIIALALILLAVSWAYQRYKGVILGTPE